jgi:molybdenum cofactor cytidylyltransferase
MLSLIVLAAGKSNRMQGKNKLLEKIDEKPMIRRVVENALSSMVDEVIVVVGWEAAKVMTVLADLPCRYVENKDYEIGQSSSVRAGMREVSIGAEAVLILPGDVARIDAHSINKVVETYHRTQSPIVVASYQGKSGHPILFSKELFGEIQGVDEATFGLKSVTTKHDGDIRQAETGSENVLRDVDTPEDLKRMKG